MGVLIQGFFKRALNIAVPSPADGDPSVEWWWDHLARQASDLRRSGFTASWIPPVLKAAEGSGPAAHGYTPFDDYVFRLTFYSVMWKAGLMTGCQRVQETLALSESGHEYTTGSALVGFLDASGKFVFGTSSEIGPKLESRVQGHQRCEKYTTRNT